MCSRGVASWRIGQLRRQRMGLTLQLMQEMLNFPGVSKSREELTILKWNVNYVGQFRPWKVRVRASGKSQVLAILRLPLEWEEYRPKIPSKGREDTFQREEGKESLDHTWHFSRKPSVRVRLSYLKLGILILLKTLNTSNQIGKEVVKLSLLADYVLLTYKL